jgi:adenylate kinase
MAEKNVECYNCLKIFLYYDPYNRNHTEIYLCPKCTQNETLLLSKAVAKTDFCIIEDDLENLPYNVVKSKSGHLIQYYYKGDVEDRGIAKYGSLKELRQRVLTRLLNGDHIRKKRKEKKDYLQSKADERVQLLEEELRNYNIDIDLYKNLHEYNEYKNGNPDYILNDVVKKIVEDYFLLRNTKYRVLYRKNKDDKTDDEIKQMAIEEYINKGNPEDSIPITLLKYVTKRELLNS